LTATFDDPWKSLARDFDPTVTLGLDVVEGCSGAV
jgi:hypothetical protein